MAESPSQSPPPLPDLIARGPLALFLDFDGTLVEIADTPDAIIVPQGLTRRLERLGQREHIVLAIVSGRGLDDLEQHLGPFALCRAGSHGIECRRADGSCLGVEPQPLTQQVVQELQDFAEASGIAYEAKRHGGALHFRQHPEAQAPTTRFAYDLAKREGLEVKTGKGVAELVRPGADKGSAVRAFMAIREFDGAIPVFVGDDFTDEDGFEAASELGGFGVIVGEREKTKARYRVDTVAEVHRWLKL